MLTEQWRRQIETLEHASSISARLLTANEHAENHCQVGNQGLALRTIVQWLDATTIVLDGTARLVER